MTEHSPHRQPDMMMQSNQSESGHLLNTLAARIAGKADLAERLGGPIGFDLGPEGTWSIGGRAGGVREGTNGARCVVRVSTADLQGMIGGSLNPRRLRAEGRLSIAGNAQTALQLVYLWEIAP